MDIGTRWNIEDSFNESKIFLNCSLFASLKNDRSALILTPDVAWMMLTNLFDNSSSISSIEFNISIIFISAFFSFFDKDDL